MWKVFFTACVVFLFFLFPTREEEKKKIAGSVNITGLWA
jgi:hypothetical protein